ncbi:MAG: rubrerythrin family protein [Deltaproteobacteria bacterium]|jgi:rubrerythrin|nr:rubrerythrin family protein [Deltaproteobacteria bacterium]
MATTDKQVIADLKGAFAGESQANRKYLAYAKKADEEGFPYAARIFRAAAEAETIHAHSHLRVLDGVKSTAENLQDAIGGETYEFTTMYPEMLEHAKAAGDKVAERDFHLANEAEKVHAALYKKVAADPKQALQKVYVCKVCGHVHEGSIPDQCPICGGKAQVYFEVV